MKYTFRTLITAWIVPMLFLPFDLLAQVPPNNLCANAITVGCNSVTPGTTIGATNAGAPGTCITSVTSAGGVWYRVTGWGGGMKAALCGSDYDTKMAIYTGSCGSFTCVTGNDDDFGPGGAGVCGEEGIVSSVSWNSSSGTSYIIYVSGFSTGTGNFVLTVTCGDASASCTSNGMVLELKTDANGSQTSYELIPEGVGIPVCSGSGLPNNATITNNCCVPDGCYRLRVLDSAGDGMTTGGYTLRTSANDRIIDNTANFSTGSVSAISGDQAFCLPIGTDRVIFTSCDKLDWVNNDFIVASLNPAVSAEWVTGGSNSQQDADSGYEFWFFDPNGTYSFRWFRPHNTSHGYGTGEARAAHLRINNWLATYHIPASTLMNVRVRGRVNGVNMEWGPACRFMIDPVAAACPMTKLMDIPGNQFLSCGQYRLFEQGSYVHARPVSGATQYQFRFRQPGEGFEVIRTNTSYFVQLFWTGMTLVNGSQYDVDVRAFKGGQWCPWGEVCTLNIGVPPGMQAGSEALFGTEKEELVFNMWPNPNNGDQLFISLSSIEENVSTVSVDILDLSGKKMTSQRIATQGGFMNTVIDLEGEIAAGMYLVNITAGEKVYTERLVVQP